MSYGERIWAAGFNWSFSAFERKTIICHRYLEINKVNKSEGNRIDITILFERGDLRMLFLLSVQFFGNQLRR